MYAANLRKDSTQEQVYKVVTKNTSTLSSIPGKRVKEDVYKAVTGKTSTFSSILGGCANIRKRVEEEVDEILDKEGYSLEELLDEEETIQECKALNSRLINFLRERSQVEQLLRYIVEEVSEEAESKRAFKFPFISCEIFTCEIDVILKALVDDEELMNLLFSFLEPTRPHSASLAGYFSKVIVCLMLRKTVPLMNYVQAHPDIIRQLVDLIGITSIMEVLVRLVGADDHMYSNFMDVMQWLADSNLLEMIVDKLSPSSPPEVHANAAETLCSISRSAPSALAIKLSSPSFVARIFGHALEDSQSKSGLVHSLSVCICLLDPKRSVSSPWLHSMRSQYMYEPPIPINPETLNAMLPKLGDLLTLLNVSSDEKVLPTTYGELRPPLGTYRLKIVEFIAVLLCTGNEIVEKELVCSGAIKKILDLFFWYPFNNALHHNVDTIISSCLESKNNSLISHIFRDCNLAGKILQLEGKSVISCDSDQPTISAPGRQAPRAGNLGHITRISNKLVQLGNGNQEIQSYLQENDEWVNWQTSVLQERNTVENIYHWGCGRPTALQDRTRDSDDDELHDRDYDVAALANNLSQVFRYSMYENDDDEEVHGSLERDDEDVYFDDESAEVVISSLRLGDEQESLFTNSNWFTSQDDRNDDGPQSTSPEKMDEISLNEPTNGGNTSGSDDEVVVGEDEELVVNNTALLDEASKSTSGFSNGFAENTSMDRDTNLQDEKPTASDDLGELSNVQVSGSNWNPFNENNKPGTDISTPTENGNVVDEEIAPASPMDSTDGPVGTSIVPSLFEEDVEFVGLDSEGIDKAIEHVLEEGTGVEAGPLKTNQTYNSPEYENSEEDDAGMLELNDTNYWRVDQEVAVVQP
ncbi:hypothetical protein GIB67_027637 [Kingdonia uniflora]|uniref:SIT4 phosphatase-associated family protein n=1 Tax=Kingdonia uniflora TaxID=39325 RepID=A0A7J7NKU3_9MAGN|nr:hypothetical protein GIB67_027637 [Kingdonia uniflora]